MRTISTKTMWFDNINASDIADVGGKNASLGEMITQLKETGISVPDGFAITTSAYISFLEHNDLSERIAALVEEFKNESKSLQSVGSSIRNLILPTLYPWAYHSASLSHKPTWQVAESRYH